MNSVACIDEAHVTGKRKYVDYLALEFRLLGRSRKMTYPKTQRKTRHVYSAVQRITAGIHNSFEIGCNVRNVLLGVIRNSLLPGAVKDLVVQMESKAVFRRRS